jgi:hypothetical protein
MDHLIGGLGLRGLLTCTTAVKTYVPTPVSKRDNNMETAEERVLPIV